MTTSYPGALDTFANPGATTFEDAPGFELDVVISNLNDAVKALEAKLGIGGGAPGATPGVLRRTAAAASAWSQIVDGDVSGGAGISPTKLGPGGNVNMVVGSVDGSNMTMTQINNSMIGAGQISGDRLQNGTITSTQLAANAATAIAFTSLSGSTNSVYPTWFTLATLTPTFAGGRVKLDVSIVLTATGTFNAYIGYKLDGGADTQMTINQAPVGAYTAAVAFADLGVLTGAHTILIRWAVSAAGTIVANAGSICSTTEYKR